MNDMTTNVFTSKSSMKMIGQVVDITYHGPIASTTGGGALGMLMRQVSPKQEINLSNEKSSASVDMLVHLGVDSPADIVSEKFKNARDTFMIAYASRQQKVKKFHDTLNDLKFQALEGNTSKKLTQEEVDRIRLGMRVRNVGKIIKITLQTRLVSENPFPGSHVSRDGHSLTRTLYTFYYPYDSKTELSEQLNVAAMAFAGWYNQPVTGVSSAINAELNVKDDLKSIKLSAVQSVTKTVTFSDGTEKSLNPEDLKPNDIKFRLSNAFSK